MDLRRFDLNLLISFDILMKERNVTRAAKRLFISQSAMSHNLRKLRSQLDDPLLVPTSGGMRPTQRSLELEGPIREMLMNIQWNLNPPVQFEPLSSKQCFVMGSTDYVEYVFLPPLLRHLKRVAPGVNIHLKRTDINATEEELERGTIDLAIQRVGQQFSSGVQQTQLLQESTVALLRADHPSVREELTMADYIQLPHIVVDSLQVLEKIQDALGQLSKAMRIQLHAPNFLSAPIILSESDMIATLPRLIAERFIMGGRLKILSLPFELETFDMQMCCHRLLEADSAQCWFREQITEVAAQLAQARPGS